MTIFKEYFLVEGKLVPVIKGGKGKGGKGCFAKGTLITTDCGYKKIEDVAVGDLVVSFNNRKEKTINKVTEIFFHQNQKVVELITWSGRKLLVTPNHWFFTEEGTFKEIQNFNSQEAVVGHTLFNVDPIISINPVSELMDTYNFTVENDHTYFAETIAVHNKGGGKSGGSEAENTLFSTDILFVTIGLGEGPMYRVNPNGPQDIEINEGTIDNLINLDGNGSINTDLFFYAFNTGTVTQGPLQVFGDDVETPQNMANPVQLKKGNISGVPRNRVHLQDTSSQIKWDKLRFKFTLNQLFSMDSSGNTNGHTVSVKVTIFNSTADKIIGIVDRTITGKTTTQYRFDLDFVVPEPDRSTSGYKFTVEKSSDDSSQSRVQDDVVFYGWDEIQFGKRAYPRTAIIGYAIKATDEYKGNIPTVTTLVKGLLCKVPSNYNQPILSTSDIDWREVEVPSSYWTGSGYRLQKTGSTVQTTANPLIYDGLWDGSFTYSWTQNPVWIVYDMLTNTSYGLGIPEKNIDKYNFYRIAQYCDAVDPSTGRFYGVDGVADGSFRYKPLNTFTSVREVLVGLNSGTPIKERRFICDINISSQKQVLDIISLVTALFRGILFYSFGKLALNVDMPDDLPVAIFNETNIIKDSLVISGTKETDIISGVEVTFIDPANHYRRETIRIDDDTTLRELSNIENVKQVELTGCTRRSQAVRFAQYLLASGKYLRRKLTFKTSLEGVNLTVGDIIAVSLRVPGTAWGYAGRVFANSTVGNSNVFLEHFTSPSLANSVFTGNTLPLSLRIIKQNSDKVDYYLISNTNFALTNTSNVISGFDMGRVVVLRRFDPLSKTFAAATYQWEANTVPIRGDLWTLGEINPSNFYSSQADKLFKITDINRQEDDDISISALEYIANVYTDSDTIISYTPASYKDLYSPLAAPPAPILDLFPRPVEHPDGQVTYNVDINSTTDSGGYPIAIETVFQVSFPDEIVDIIG